MVISFLFYIYVCSEWGYSIVRGMLGKVVFLKNIAIDVIYLNRGSLKYLYRLLLYEVRSP